MAQVNAGRKITIGENGQELVIQLVREFLSALHSRDIRIAAAYLYGSYASGTAVADSDIDVAIVSPDLAGDRLQDWIRLTFLATSIDPRFEVVGFRPDQFRDEHPLAWEIKTRGIQLQ